LYGVKIQSEDFRNNSVADPVFIIVFAVALPAAAPF
jgi:hypothetical protein